MWALKQLGVTCIVPTTACGSLKEEYKPGNAGSWNTNRFPFRQYNSSCRNQSFQVQIESLTLKRSVSIRP